MTAARTSSLNLRNERLVQRIIEAALDTPFGPHVTPQTDELDRDAAGLSSGRAEFADGERFFRMFDGVLRHDDLRGRRVLDVGCGYGGRTIFYAKVCGACGVAGVEPDEEVVRRCRALAAELECEAAEFVAGSAEALPYEGRTFDAVVSFDVLEHVEDPHASVREIHRVLRDGGTAWLVFPTYLGARSSHLDYITRVPALHRIFHPATLVRAVNNVIRERPEITPIREQPPPEVSSLGRLTLPKLNGMTLDDARRFLAGAGLRPTVEILHPLIDELTPVPGARVMAPVFRTLRRVLPFELLIGSIAVAATKR